MAYIPKTKSKFYNLLGSMVLGCPDYRSSISTSDHGLEGSFDRMNESIALLYPDNSDPIREQLLRMSAEAKRLSEAALESIGKDDDLRKKCTLKASQIFVDMEMLMKGKPLRYYNE